MEHCEFRSFTGSQYHFYMETLSALCIPKEDNQIQLYATTQWMDFTQNLVAAALGIQINQIDMEVRRLGGGYGGKGIASFFVATATAVASWKVNKPVRYISTVDHHRNETGISYKGFFPKTWVFPFKEGVYIYYIA